MVKTVLKVLILGSGPNAAVPDADIIYCANSSASYYAEEFRPNAEVRCVVGSHIIAAVPDSQAPDPVKAARSSILGLDIDQFICLNHNPWYPGWDLEAGLQQLSTKPGRAVRIVNDVERAEILLRTSGLSEPIFSYTWWVEATRMGPLKFLKSARRLSKHFRRHAKHSVRETHEVLRPSTGLIAATIAMDEHGTDAKYMLSGIGLSLWSDRSTHPRGISQGTFRDFVHHKHADIRLLKALRKKYSIDYLPPKR